MPQDRFQAPAGTGKMRVLIADDHAVLRQGVAVLIEREADICVVAQASGGHEAIELAEAHQPDVAVIDVSMPDLDGLRTTVALREKCPQTRVIALTRHADASYLQRMLSAGARGYVLKRSAAEDLVKAIRAVGRGSTYVDPDLADRYGEKILGRSKYVSGAGVSLTGRERDVLALVAWGHSNAEIARRLEISVKTVEFYRACAVQKLNLRGRSEIVRYAMREGWINDDNAPE